METVSVEPLDLAPDLAVHCVSEEPPTSELVVQCAKAGQVERAWLAYTELGGASSAG